MKLSYHRGAEPNFGDELNATVWPALLPGGFLDDDEDTLLVGIGSILNTGHRARSVKHVLGSGFGGYTEPPDLADGTWRLHWVRGPRTAAKFDLDPGLAITDSAILLAALPRPGTTAAPADGSAATVCFMPHLDSVARGDWRRVCKLCGITYLDPRDAVPDLLARIAASRLVITEAMHGAIVADTLRVPWIGIRPFLPLHRNKWLDWAESLAIDLKPVRARPSSLREAWAEQTGLDARGRRTRLILEGPLAAPGKAWVAHRAADFLTHLSHTGTPQLSGDVNFARALERSLTALDRFVRVHSGGADVRAGLVAGG